MSEKIEQRKYGFWNWGTGITITIIIGALATLFLVYKTTTINFEMAEDDYYAQELNYNSKLRAMENARHLSSSFSIVQEDSSVKISVPAECRQVDSGNIKIYRPSSQKHDLLLSFTPDSNGNIFIDKSQMITGLYNMKASWYIRSTEYYKEQSFYVENR